MKAIILSAGRGTRLLPLTEEIPKCLLPVNGDRSVLEEQLIALSRGGIRDITVMVGFGAGRVEEFLRTNPVPGVRVRTLYNPFYDVADNLVTVWLARAEMDEDFVLLNGDTLFEPAVLESLLATSTACLTLAVNEKDEYDDDDMKVRVIGRRLVAVSKELDPATVDSESIGLMVFRGEGGKYFREILDEAVRAPAGKTSWYLSIVDRLAQRVRVEVAPITGLWSGEVDSPEDLADVRVALEGSDVSHSWLRAARAAVA